MFFNYIHHLSETPNQQLDLQLRERGHDTKLLCSYTTAALKHLYFFNYFPTDEEQETSTQALKCQASFASILFRIQSQCRLEVPTAVTIKHK